MLRSHRHRMTRREELSHVERNVSVAELVRDVLAILEQPVHPNVVHLQFRSRSFPLWRVHWIGISAQAHQTHHVRKEHLVGFELSFTRLRSRGNGTRPKGRFRPTVLQVLEYLGGVEQLDLAVDEDWHLMFGIDAQHFGMLRRIAAFKVERHHHQIKFDALFACGDLDLRTKHAEWTGVDLHAIHERMLSGDRRTLEFVGSSQ